MPTISRDSLEAYNAALDGIADAIGEMLTAGLDGLQMQSPEALHDFVMNELAFDELMEVATDDAAAVSEQWYQEISEMLLGDVAAGLALDSMRDPVATDKAVWAISTQAQDRGIGYFVAEILNRSKYEIRRAAGESVYNYGKNGSENCRFARVPSWSKSYGAGCPWCRMLASRGFVYETEKTAGADGHYHAKCRCVIVPAPESSLTKVITTKGATRYLSDIEVEGYDPEALFEEYLDNVAKGATYQSKGKVSSPSKWASEKFDSFSDMGDYVKGAKSVEDLQDRCSVIEKEWSKTGLSDRYFNDLKAVIRNQYKNIMLG